MVPVMSDYCENPWSGVAIITGASTGIGAATARKLANGATGLVIGARNIEKLESVASECGDHVVPLQCDVQQQADVQQLANTAIERFGRIDAIINNAGILPMASMTRCRVEDWVHTVDTNIKGVLFGIAAVLPQMLEQKTGHIVNIGSGAGRQSYAGAAVYCGTKHAVRAIGEGLQLDLSMRSAKDGNSIRVTTIAPGVVRTELAQSVTYEPAKVQLQHMLDHQEGALTPEDIAHCILIALTTPDHVEIGEMTVRPTKQLF